MHGQELYCNQKGLARALKVDNKTCYSQLKIYFSRSCRGKKLLNLNDKPFTLNRKIKDACYWECVKMRCKYTKCSARAITKFDEIISIRGVHNHN
ncbi:uncharacterized protein LOC119677745 [Teleopsis dalmanni]|uniref:uncharacterized protein LOC119677745 n=1 Tax=Teleopsis dalmanni TaxID=139649 RepID=UPI0018CE425A|nr:uncharacterized protein LOC119677745 [Teleopsis dalmanni]